MLHSRDEDSNWRIRSRLCKRFPPRRLLRVPTAQRSLLSNRRPCIPTTTPISPAISAPRPIPARSRRLVVDDHVESTTTTPSDTSLGAGDQYENPCQRERGSEEPSPPAPRPPTSIRRNIVAEDDNDRSARPRFAARPIPAWSRRLLIDINDHIESTTTSPSDPPLGVGDQYENPCQRERGGKSSNPLACLQRSAGTSQPQAKETTEHPPFALAFDDDDDSTRSGRSTTSKDRTQWQSEASALERKHAQAAHPILPLTTTTTPHAFHAATCLQPPSVNDRLHPQRTRLAAHPSFALDLASSGSRDRVQQPNRGRKGRTQRQRAQHHAMARRRERTVSRGLPPTTKTTTSSSIASQVPCVRTAPHLQFRLRFANPIRAKARTLPPIAAAHLRPQRLSNRQPTPTLVATSCILLRLDGRLHCEEEGISISSDQQGRSGHDAMQGRVYGTSSSHFTVHGKLTNGG
ncbi:hypothetical protein BJ912DRAFT_1077928 [Pholiota molesta]|nr:hypothetical protein BJ912DRAFT_1077928 [Pholiota molesta]